MAVQQADQDMVRAIYLYAAELMQQGHSETQIESALQDRGLPNDMARTVVSKIASAHRKSRKQAAYRAFLGGIGICIFGIVASLLSYQAVASNITGGTYYVWYGAVLYGGFQILRGMYLAIR